MVPDHESHRNVLKKKKGITVKAPWGIKSVELWFQIASEKVLKLAKTRQTVKLDYFLFREYVGKMTYLSSKYLIFQFEQLLL